MNASLIRYELLLLWRDRGTCTALLALGALVVLALTVSAVQLSRSDAARAEVAQAERERWLGQGEKDPHTAAHYSVYAFKPAPALAALEQGVEPFVGQAIWLEAHAQNDALYRPQVDASALQRMARIGPAGLIIGFAPLVAFLLTFATLAQERERGTLRLSLGTAVNVRRIVSAKAWACWLLLLIVLVVPAVVLSLVFAGVGGKLTGDVLLRALMWLAVAAVYLGVLTALGMAVCVRSGNARPALTVLFGAWIVLALLVPRWTSTAANSIASLPSSQSVRQTLTEEASGYWSAEQGQQQLAQLLERHGVTSREELPVDARGAELDLVERHSHQVFDRVLGGFYDQVIAQDRLYAQLAWLSPAAVLQALSPALAGTNFQHHRFFIDGAEQYRRALVNRMNEDVMAHPLNGDQPRHTNDIGLWSQIPPFEHLPPGLGQTGASLSAPLLALLVWLAAALALLVRFSARLKP